MDRAMLRTVNWINLFLFTDEFSDRGLPVSFVSSFSSPVVNRHSSFSSNVIIVLIIATSFYITTKQSLSVVNEKSLKEEFLHFFLLVEFYLPASTKSMSIEEKEVRRPCPPHINDFSLLLQLSLFCLFLFSRKISLGSKGSLFLSRHSVYQQHIWFLHRPEVSFSLYGFDRLRVLLNVRTTTTWVNVGKRCIRIWYFLSVDVVVVAAPVVVTQRQRREEAKKKGLLGGDWIVMSDTCHRPMRNRSNISDYCFSPSETINTIQPAVMCQLCEWPLLARVRVLVKPWIGYHFSKRRRSKVSNVKSTYSCSSHSRNVFL